MSVELLKKFAFFLIDMAWTPYGTSQIKIHNAQNSRSGELSSCFYDTNKNEVKLHGWHIQYNYADMAMETMCLFPSQHHGLPHWKCVLRCCKKCSSLSIPCLKKKRRSKDVFKNTFSCVQKCIMLYYAWSTPSRRTRNMFYVFHWWYFCDFW